MADEQQESQALVTIAETAARTGLSADTLRFYERSALLPPIKRTAGGQRRYSQRDLVELTRLRGHLVAAV